MTTITDPTCKDEHVDPPGPREGADLAPGLSFGMILIITEITTHHRASTCDLVD
jgi:hypothetical protein